MKEQIKHASLWALVLITALIIGVITRWVCPDPLGNCRLWVAGIATAICVGTALIGMRK